MSTEAALSLGERIRRERKTRGWSLDKLASEVGVSKVSVWGWEHDRSKPRLQVLERLGAALDVAPHILLGDNDASNGQVPEIIADCQSRIAHAVGVGVDAVEIRITFGGPSI
jgi:transcriptional regulator with XRE-family HTH domain